MTWWDGEGDGAPAPDHEAVGSPAADEPPAALPPPDASTRTPAGHSRRKSRVIGTVMLVVGLLVMGVAGGVALGRSTAEVQEAPIVFSATDTVPDRTSDTSGGAGGSDSNPVVTAPPIVMPDVIGLDRTEAEEALADAGIDPTTITVEERAFVGEAGRVVEQRPTRRSSDPTDVVIVLSTPATVPDVVRATDVDARTTLEELGAAVQLESVFAEGFDAGTIVATVPAAGEPLPFTIVLQVAAPPAELFLDQVDAVDGSCSTGSTTINGTPSDHALLCNADDDPSRVDYVLGRGISRFRANVGVSDEAEDGVPVRVVIRGDDVVRFDQTVRYGESVPVDVDVTGVLRMSIEVTAIPPADDSYASTTLALGDARIVGAPDVIAQRARDGS